VPRDQEADAEEQHRLDLLDQRVQRVGQNPLKRRAAFFDSRHDPSEAWLRENHAGRPFGSVGGGRHGDADLCLPQGGRVIGAIAAHPDGMAGFLEGLDQAKLVLSLRNVSASIRSGFLSIICSRRRRSPRPIC
jgi:hypothetical protein